MSIKPDALPVYFAFAQAKQLGVSDRRLRDWVTRGVVHRFAPGVYHRAEAPLADLDLAEIALRAPDAVLCLTTAPSHYDLTDAIPGPIDVALPHSRRQPKLTAAIRWHRFHEGTFELGAEQVRIGAGLSVRFYSAERTLLDLFRLRHLEGGEVAFEALRRWLGRPRSHPARLLELARSFPKTEPSLLQALRVMA